MSGFVVNMEIHRQNFQSPKFTSRICPIKPSVVNTKWGKLTLEEVKPIDIIQKGFFEKILILLIGKFLRTQLKNQN